MGRHFYFVLLCLALVIDSAQSLPNGYYYYTTSNCTGTAGAIYFNGTCAPGGFNVNGVAVSSVLFHGQEGNCGTLTGFYNVAGFSTSDCTGAAAAVAAVATRTSFDGSAFSGNDFHKINFNQCQPQSGGLLKSVQYVCNEQKEQYPPYKNMCANPTDYDGDAQYFSESCDQAITKLSRANGNIWPNVNWTTVTCSDLGESGTYVRLNTVGSICCGGKATICTPDYSRVCKDPSKYTPDATVAYTGGAICGSYTLSQWHNITNWGTLQCSDFTGDPSDMRTAKGLLTGSYWGLSCCSDKQNLCDKDYSKLCKEPSTYQGTKLWATNSNINCNGMMKSQSTGQGPFSAVDWTNPTCISTMSTFSRCCSNEKTICWKDNSNYCKNPSDYTPSKVITGGANCDYYINLVLGSSWGTCADINVTKAFGNSGNTVGELMSGVITPSCCGTSNQSLCDSSTTTTKAPKNADTSNGVLLHSDTKVFFVAFIIWIGLLH